jgi:DNA adenine methylase
MAQTYFSPLRYPGGKSSLYDFLSKIIEYNNLSDGVYAEAFAGGAGVAIKLLMLEHVGEIILNDKDPFVYRFWKSVLNHNEELCKLIRDTPVTIDEWQKRSQIIKDKTIWKNFSDVEIGFTAFFLNRCNRSGILNAGVIGGQDQQGEWRLDARYNKSELIDRIYKIGFYSDRIQLHNKDAVKFISHLEQSPKFENNRTLLYLDPPYVGKGKDLYIEYFNKNDHIRFGRFIHTLSSMKWIISYDDVPLIHSLYKESRKNIIEFNYFANRVKLGNELIISSSNCKLPSFYQHYSVTKKTNATREVQYANVI